MDIIPGDCTPVPKFFLLRYLYSLHQYQPPSESLATHFSTSSPKLIHTAIYSELPSVINTRTVPKLAKYYYCTINADNIKVYLYDNYQTYIS